MLKTITMTARKGRRIWWPIWLLLPFILLFLVLLPLLIEEWTLWQAILVIGIELAAILFVIALWSRSRLGPWAARGVALILFLFCLSYFVDQWFLSDKSFKLVERRSNSSPRNSLIALLVFGLPCLWAAVRPEKPRTPKSLP